MIYHIQEYLFFDLFCMGLRLPYSHGVPEKSQRLYRTRFKVKFIIHRRPVSAATNWSLIASSSKFADNSPGTKRFRPDHPPASLYSIGVDHRRDGEA